MSDEVLAFVNFTRSIPKHLLIYVTLELDSKTELHFLGKYFQWLLYTILK